MPAGIPSQQCEGQAVRCGDGNGALKGAMGSRRERDYGRSSVQDVGCGDVLCGKPIGTVIGFVVRYF